MIPEVDSNSHSISTYTLQKEGCIATDQRIESVGLFLASFVGMRGIPGTQGTADAKGKSLEKQKIAVS